MLRRDFAKAGLLLVAERVWSKNSNVLKTKNI
jgi:hypothetical protein